MTTLGCLMSNLFRKSHQERFFLLRELIWTVFIHVSLFLLSRVSPGSFGSGVHRAIALRHDADLRRDHLFDADFLRALPRQLNGQKQDPDRMSDLQVMRLMRRV